MHVLIKDYLNLSLHANKKTTKFCKFICLVTCCQGNGDIKYFNVFIIILYETENFVHFCFKLYGQSEHRHVRLHTEQMRYKNLYLITMIKDNAYVEVR